MSARNSDGTQWTTLTRLASIQSASARASSLRSLLSGTQIVPPSESGRRTALDKRVPQRRSQLADTHAVCEPQRLGFPGNEVADALESSGDGFRCAGRAGGEI